MNKVIFTKLKDGRYTLSTGSGGTKKYQNAGAAYNRLERIFKRNLEAKLRDKTCVRTKLDGRYAKATNESLASTDKRYLLYALGCFLEDELSVNKMNQIERDYCNES